MPSDLAKKKAAKKKEAAKCRSRPKKADEENGTEGSENGSEGLENGTDAGERNREPESLQWFCSEEWWPV